MSRVYGARYAETADLHLPGVAQLIRDDLKTAAKSDGPLAGLTFSVRCRNRLAIDVTVDGLTDAEIFDLSLPQPQPISGRGAAVRVEVRAITDAYNYDCSDRDADYFDVRFYSHISLVTDDERTYRKSMAALKTRR